LRAAVHTDEIAVDQGSTPAVLEAEYEHEPVPASARKSLGAVSLVWLGFPMVLTMALIGSLVVEGLGFQQGVLAIVIGNLVLFVYVGALSLLAQRQGLSFALLSSTTLGKKGYVAASVLLSTVVLGWFVVQTGLTAVSLNSAFGWPLVPLATAAGVLYVAITLYGVRALATIGVVSAPLFLAFGAYAVYLSVSAKGWDSIMSYEPSPAKTISFALGLSLVVASFIGSGTLTADFTRWARRPSHALIATFSAFPIANGIAMLIGAVVAGAGARTASLDLFSLVAGKGGVTAVLAIVFLLANLGSVCTHCLYNSAVGWSHVLRTDMRRAALVLGGLGTVVAALGVWSYFLDWLNLMSVIIPPIGGILLADHFIVRRRGEGELTRVPDFQLAPFLTWAIVGGTALLVNFYLRWIPVVVWGMVIAFVLHPLIVRLVGRGVARNALTGRQSTHT
jgi:cytosine permease